MYVTHDQVEAMTMGHRIAVMSDGVLQQIGTPQDVYRRPANVFVATFLGAPPMNLIDGALESDGRRLALPRRERRRGALGGGDQRSRAASTRSRRAARSSSACGQSTSGSGRPARSAVSPAACSFLEPVGSDLYLTVEAGGTIGAGAHRPRLAAAAGRQRVAPLRRLARARVRRGRPQPPSRRTRCRVHAALIEAAS